MTPTSPRSGDVSLRRRRERIRETDPRTLSEYLGTGRKSFAVAFHIRRILQENILKCQIDTIFTRRMSHSHMEIYVHVQASDLSCCGLSYTRLN